MPINDPNAAFDGWDSLEGGVDAGRSPNIIDTNQCRDADNLTFRGGRPTTRPGIRDLEHVFTNSMGYHSNGFWTDAPTGDELGSETNWKDSTFQCAQYFAPLDYDECMVALIGGRLYRIDPLDYSLNVTEIKLDFRNPDNIVEGFLTQADKWMVIQDGVSRPILYDGFIARRSADDEVPVGKIMCYGMGRLIVTRNGQEIIFGDLYGSHLDLEDGGDSVIKFTETIFLAEGFPAAVPVSLGRITGAAFFPQLDTSTGTGQFFVFTGRGAVSFDLGIERSQWKTTDFQRIVLMTTGVRGWRSITPVNEDLWFRATEGARTFRQARSEASGWHHIPLSTNVRQWFDADWPELLDFVSTMYLDNRLIFTVSPAWNHARPYFNGLVVVDFDVLSSFGANQKPAWDGHWDNEPILADHVTKLKFCQLVSGYFKDRYRGFAFCIDENGENKIVEISLSDRKDYSGDIRWAMGSRAFDFSRDKSGPYSEKSFYGAEVWLNHIATENVTMNAKWKPDDIPDFLDLAPTISTGMVLDPDGFDLDGLTGDVLAREGFAPRQMFFKPPYKGDTVTSRDIRRGYQYEIRLEGTGHMAIERFRIYAQQLTERGRAVNAKPSV